MNILKNANNIYANFKHNAFQHSDTECFQTSFHAIPFFNPDTAILNNFKKNLTQLNVKPL